MKRKQILSSSAPSYGKHTKVAKGMTPKNGTEKGAFFELK